MDRLQRLTEAAFSLFHGKTFDCLVGSGGCALGVWLGEHWMTLLGAAILAYRGVQTFFLEPIGVDTRPGWLVRMIRRRRRGW